MSTNSSSGFRISLLNNVNLDELAPNLAVMVSPRPTSRTERSVHGCEASARSGVVACAPSGVVS